MKFVSKYDNYRVVLKNGIPPEPITGRLAVAGLSVRFEGGSATINDESVVALMLKHEGCNRDFFPMTGEETDVSKIKSKSLEPEHDIYDINYGHPGKNINPIPKSVSNDQRDLIVSTAKQLAKEMFKEMMAEMSNKEKEADSNIKESSETFNEDSVLSEINKNVSLEENSGIVEEKKKSLGRPKKSV